MAPALPESRPATPARVPPGPAPAGRRAWPLALLSVLCVARAGAVDLTLDSVTATGPGGEVRLRVDSRATFDFDPATGTLRSAGTWIAEYTLPNRLTRFAHKVEDLRATADGQLTVRSYECVEGAFGAAFLAASLCGNYRFGQNGLDDGGLPDDEVVAPPRSFDRYRVSSLEWDGAELRLVLGAAGPAEAGQTEAGRAEPGKAAEGTAGGDLFPEDGLTLVLRAGSGTAPR